MKIYQDIIQGTPEWHAIRKGKMTASHAQEIANCGKGLETYIYEVVASGLSSGAVEYYSNANMDRGNELEGAAREMYELTCNAQVKQVGFVEHNDFAGCSPDGLIGDSGLVEIKCHNDVNHLKLLLGGEKAIETKYVWQMQMNMFITGRIWTDYVAYNPNFRDSLLVFRVSASTKAFSEIEKGLQLGQMKIEEIKSKLNQKYGS